MDYFNFIAECQGLSSYSNKTIQILYTINSILSDYFRMKEQLLKNMKLSLNGLISQINKPINSTYKLKYSSYLEKNTLKVISFLKEALSKESRENDLLNSEIISPLSSFIKHINNQNILLFNEFKTCIDEIYKQKRRCDLSKDNYINCGKQITILAEKLNNIGNENNNESKELNNNLNILKNKFQKFYIEYKENVSNTNKLYEDKNKQYFSYMLKLKETEDSKETFMNFYFEKFDNFLKNKLKILSTFETGFNGIIPDSKNEKDLKEKRRVDFSEQLNSFVIDVEKQTRIKNEEFIDYDTYKKQLSALINQNRMYLKEDTKNNRINFNPQEILINTIDSTSISSFSKKNSNEDYIFSQEENILIENIFLIEEIDSFKAEQLILKIKNNFEYAQNIIDKVLERYTSSIGVQILNENNFIKFGKMINGVLLNKEIQENLFEINFAVIYIAEKTFYQKEENPFYKRYLCKLLSELNDGIRNKQFWFKLLSIRIKLTLENETNIKTKQIFKEEKKKKMEEEKKKKMEEEKNKKNNNNTNNNNLNDKRRNSAIVEKGKKFFGFGIAGMVGNLFGRENSGASLEEKERKEKEILRKKEIYNEVYKNITNEVAIRMIKDFIVHFSCFCVESYDVIDIVSDISNKYKIIGEEKKIKYFISILNSNMYSIKNTKFKITSENLNRNSDLSKFMNKNYIQGNVNKNNKSLILLNIMKYLPFSDYKNILLVNKSTYKLIIHILFANLLINVDENIPEEYLKKNPIPNVWKTPDLRLKIWKYLLNFKNDVNYKQIIEDINKEENKQDCFELIEMDVKRMWFDENIEEIRKSLNNILRALAYLHPKISYSQGMNCIASLLYDICGSEEEAFNIFNCLLISTDYGDLYSNELKRLNKYFYVFERLIFIYLPEVYLHLTSTKISPKFFISPWFITLFTNAYKTIKGKVKPKVLIWILDSFIIEGWRAINKIGLCLMKHFEKKILNMDTDELLHFLINDIINYDFFKNANYDGLRNIYDNLQIENGLIENIENEYEIKNTIFENNNMSINKDK